MGLRNKDKHKALIVASMNGFLCDLLTHVLPGPHLRLLLTKKRPESLPGAGFILFTGCSNGFFQRCKVESRQGGKDFIV